MRNKRKAKVSQHVGGVGPMDKHLEGGQDARMTTCGAKSDIGSFLTMSLCSRAERLNTTCS